MRLWALALQINRFRYVRSVKEFCSGFYCLGIALLRTFCTSFIWLMVTWNMWNAPLQRLEVSSHLFALRR